MISLIVAMAKNRVIGRANQLPWHLPDDLKRFKQLTLGKDLILGRKTYESIGRPLAGRRLIVVTQQAIEWPQITIAQSLDAAIKLAKSGSEIMIGGGAQIYAQGLPLADCIYLTKIEAELMGDAYFPALNQNEWKIVDEQFHDADESHIFTFSFQTLLRR